MIFRLLSMKKPKYNNHGGLKCNGPPPSLFLHQRRWVPFLLSSSYFVPSDGRNKNLYQAMKVRIPCMIDRTRLILYVHALLGRGFAPAR